MKTIRVSDELHKYLESKGKKGESFEDILRRELGLQKREREK